MADKKVVKKKTASKKKVAVKKPAKTVAKKVAVAVKEPVVKEQISEENKMRLQSHLDYIMGINIDGISTKRYVSMVKGRITGVTATDKATARQQAIEIVKEKIGEKT